MNRDNDIVTRFLGGTAPDLAGIVIAIDAAILDSGTGLDRAVKWKQLAYAREGDFHYWICGIVLTRKSVSLRFHFGGLLSDPDKVFRAGTSKFLRSIDFSTTRDVDGDLISRYVREAASRLGYFRANWKQLQGQE